MSAAAAVEVGVSAKAVMARSGKTFYRAATLLPYDVRAEVMQLYAFCRSVDDLADESALSVGERDRVLAILEADLLDGGGQTAAVLGWPVAAQAKGLAGAAAVLVGAARADLHQRQPTTEDDLLRYAFGVAGTVGLMLAEMFGAQREGLPAAVALGLAMQLSNIARDVAADLAQDRAYLPADWITAPEMRRALGCDDRIAAQRLADATRRILRLADSLYEAAYDGIWSLPWRLRWSILTAGMCYRAIGAAVGRDVPASWRRRTVVGPARKAFLVAAALLRLGLPRFWRRRRAGGVPHQAALRAIAVPLRALGVQLEGGASRPALQVRMAYET